MPYKTYHDEIYGNTCVADTSAHDKDGLFLILGRLDDAQRPGHAPGTPKPNCHYSPMKWVAGQQNGTGRWGESWWAFAGRKGRRAWSQSPCRRIKNLGFPIKSAIARPERYSPRENLPKLALGKIMRRLLCSIMKNELINKIFTLENLQIIGQLQITIAVIFLLIIVPESSARALSYFFIYPACNFIFSHLLSEEHDF